MKNSIYYAVAVLLVGSTLGYSAEIGEPSSYQGENVNAEIRGWIEPGTTTPGSKVKLVLEAIPESGRYIYALGDTVADTSKPPTLIVVTEASGLEVGPTVANLAPTTIPATEYSQAREAYKKPVQWTTEFTIPADAKNGNYKVVGVMGYQTCNSDSCDVPHSATFEAVIHVAPHASEAIGAVAFGEGNGYSSVRALADTRTQANPGKSFTVNGPVDANAAGLDLNRLQLASDGTQDAGIIYYLFIGLLGGLILNLMPCVLPVVGLKILSFVEQSHHNRGQVIKLNLAYTAGLVSVFMALALFAVVSKNLLGQSFIWGQQFSDNRFTIALAAIVFVMGLSMLGVWEIPIPGFIGSSKAHGLTTKEGLSGAFFKGVITTLLATPCTGPFMAPAISWALVQPSWIVFAVFGAVGLGMASPYLIIGAYPQLVRFLPKPGAWMDTFKHLMGFVLLGTVVFLLSFIDWVLVVPTVAFLIALWGACWWIGRTPLTAPLSARLNAWGWAIAFAGVMGLLSFDWLESEMAARFERHLTREIATRLQSTPETKAVSSDHLLPWKPFSNATLTELTSEGRTVMVDFTADWCANCKFLERYVLNTPDVKQIVDANSVVPLIADHTKTPPEITAMLEALKSRGLPVLAIFPAGRPNQPIVFRELYTQQSLLNALKEAGPSKVAGPVNAAPKSTDQAKRLVMQPAQN